MLADRKRHFEKAPSGPGYPETEIIANQVSILEWVLGAKIQGPYLVTPDRQERILTSSPWPACSL